MSEMEALYKKLYEKVHKTPAVEELIQQLESEKDQLRAQVKDLLSEMAFIRSTADERCIDYQKQLMEENCKNNLLSGEVEKFQQHQLEGKFGSSYIRKNDSTKMNSEAKNLSEKSRTSSRRSTRKRSQDAPPATDQALLLSGNTQDDSMQRQSSNAMPKKSLFNGTVYDLQQLY